MNGSGSAQVLNSVTSPLKIKNTSDLAVEAGRIALENAGLAADDLDAIIIATTTPDDTFPATAASVQAKLEARNAFIFDVQAVCAGFVYALDVGCAHQISNR